MRFLAAFWPWLLGLALATSALIWGIEAIDATLRPKALNVATLLGMLALAAPAIRINEQGRLIARVQGLQKGIEAERAALRDAALAVDKRAVHQKSLAEREASMGTALKDLAGDKGAWTRPVHAALYGGYVLMLAAAIARVFA